MKYILTGLTKITLTSALILSLVACGGAEERKEKYLEKGKAYLEEKNYDKAKVEFKNVLQIDPKFAEAYFYMGQVNEKNKNLRKALANYKKAIDLNPKQTNAKIKLAKIYVIAGTEDFIKEAKKLLAQVEQEKPEDVEAELIAATIEYKTGSKEKAIAVVESIVAKNPRMVEAINFLSLVYLTNDKEKEAIELITKATADNADNVPLRLMLAKLLMKNDNALEAEKYLKQAIKIEPEKYFLQVSLSTFYVTIKEIEKAEAVLRAAIKQDGDDALRYLMLVDMMSANISLKKAEEELEKAILNKPELYELKFSKIKFYEKNGKRDEAKQLLKDIVADRTYDVEGVDARNHLARMYLEEGNTIEAKKYVDEITAEYPNNIDALVTVTKLALANLDASTAINAARTVVKSSPKNAEAAYLLAQAYELSGESLLAENELKKSIEANPVNDKTHVYYARFLGSKGRVGEALDVVDKALVYFKNSYDLLDVKLKIIVSQGKNDDVLGILDRMEQADPAKAEVNYIKGKYHISKRNLAKALEEYEKAYQKSSDKFQPLQIIIKLYVANKQVDKAYDRLKLRLDKNPDDAIANQLTGQVLLSQKKVGQARAKFIQASKAADTWFLPYSMLAATYRAEGDSKKAIEIHRKSTSKLKSKAPALMQIATIKEQQEDYAGAMKVYEEVLAENPDNKLATNNYASLLLDFGTESDFPKALGLAKQLEKLKQPALRDTLAWAYAKTGDNVKAVEMLKPIVEKAPKVAIFRYHLGYALYKTGDKAAAKSHLEIASSSKQKFTGKEEAIKLLESI